MQAGEAQGKLFKTAAKAETGGIGQMQRLHGLKPQSFAAAVAVGSDNEIVLAQIPATRVVAT